MYFWPYPDSEAVKYSGIQQIQLDTARYVRLQLDTVGITVGMSGGLTAFPWLVFFGEIPPVFHLYPACISPYPWYPVYPCVDLYLAILQQIHCGLTASRPTVGMSWTDVTGRKINRSHAHAHDSRTRTTHSHEHRASNGATTMTLNSRGRRPRPQAAAQRCASALEPSAH